MNYQYMTHLPLFQGCTEEGIRDFLGLNTHRSRSYAKGELIYHAGDHISEFGLILSGSVQMETLDLFGNRSILGLAESGDVFAESYACTANQPILVDVVACEDTQVLFISVPFLLANQQGNPVHTTIIRNLLFIASHKNVRLSMRIFHSAPKKIRDRLISYFSELVTLQGSTYIRIPMDRQQLADYLGVERTALSKELGKMKKEGLLDYRKNEFTIYPKQTFDYD